MADQNQTHSDWTAEVLSMADTSLVEQELSLFEMNNFYMLFTTKDENAAPMSHEYINARVFDPMRRGDKKLGPVWTKFFEGKDELMAQLRAFADSYKLSAKAYSITSEQHDEMEKLFRPVFTELAKLAFQERIIMNFDELYQLLSS